jgi:hypothetical protein
MIRNPYLRSNNNDTNTAPSGILHLNSSRQRVPPPNDLADNSRPPTVSPLQQPPIPRPLANDRPIVLKGNQSRAHIHRYDIRLQLKKPSADDDEEILILKSLQAMLDTLLQVDSRTIIPPYNILDRSNRNQLDLSATRQIYGQQVPCLDSLLTAKRYFSWLSP